MKHLVHPCRTVSLALLGAAAVIACKTVQSTPQAGSPVLAAPTVSATNVLKATAAPSAALARESAEPALAWGTRPPRAAAPGETALYPIVDGMCSEAEVRPVQGATFFWYGAWPGSPIYANSPFQNDGKGLVTLVKVEDEGLPKAKGGDFGKVMGSGTHGSSGAVFGGIYPDKLWSVVDDIGRFHNALAHTPMRIGSACLASANHPLDLTIAQSVSTRRIGSSHTTNHATRWTCQDRCVT
jgi:hypothetical protein